MKKHFFICCMLCVLLLSANCGNIYASDFSANNMQKTSEISPRMTYITRAAATLSIGNDGTALLVCDVEGRKASVTHISITAKLQQYKNGQWVIFDTCTKEVDSHTATLSGSCKVAKGYTYRVSATVCVRAGLSGETKQVISREVKY